MHAKDRHIYLCGQCKFVQIRGFSLNTMSFSNGGGTSEGDLILKAFPIVFELRIFKILQIALIYKGGIELRTTFDALVNFLFKSNTLASLLSITVL
jgi:hypothetical protein